MKRFVLLVVVGFLIGANATNAAELRGLWVDIWYPGFRSPAETSTLVSRARECNFNALFVQMRKRGDVCYPSAIEPLAKDIQPGYDPLADVITKAHAAGIQVHAWLIVYAAYHDVPSNTPQPGQVHLKHPEWLTKDDRGRQKLSPADLYLDPGLPEVRDYFCTIITEIVKKYDVDGIHLDKVCYPMREAGYNDAAVERFNEEKGRTGKPQVSDKEWCDWRRQQVAELVGMVHKRVSDLKPKVAVSASVTADTNDASWHKLQGWGSWLDKGALDFAVPMAFAEDPKAFEYMMNGDLAASKNRPVYIGLGAEQIKASVYAQEVAMARKAGAKGVVIYCYDSSTRPQPPDTISLMDTLKADLFAKPDTVPLMPWKQSPEH